MKEQIKDAAKAKVLSLEKRLSGIFKPITPRKEFVHRLGSRFQANNRAVIVDRVANIHLLAVLAAGLISLAVFLAVVARALVSLAAKKRTVKA